MAPRNEKFGRLLKAGISSIANIEGKTAPGVEDSLGQVIGVAGYTIQRYKAGHLPPETRTVQILAEAVVRRGLLGRAWLEQFLEAAHYPNPHELLNQLCPIHQPGHQLARVHENLPAPTYSQFVMREQVFADIVDGLQQRAPVVLLVGFSGTGKTSVTREVAARCLDNDNTASHFDAVVWVSDKDHPGTTNLSIVLDEIARLLDYPGFTQFAHDEKRRAIEQLLKRQKVLLIVDNFETTTDGALLDWLLVLPEPSKALVTSRHRHRAFRHCPQVEVRGMSVSEASALIMYRLHTLRLEYLVDNPDVFSPLIDLTNGNPKALEMTLGLMKYQHRTVREVIETIRLAQGDLFDDLLTRAWELLDEAARRVLLVLTFFPSSASESAVSAAADVAAQLALIMERLSDLSLVDVQRNDLHTPPRYALHPLVRAFAAAKLAAQPGWEMDARERWLHWCIELAGKVGFCWDDLTRLELLDAEHETLHAALLWAFEHAHWVEAIRLVEDMRYYYEVRLVWDERQAINLVRAEAARRQGDLVDEALALAQYAEIRSKQRRINETEQTLARLREIIKEVELPDQVAFSVQHAFALGSWMYGDLAGAEERWRGLLQLAQRIGGQQYVINRHWLAVSLHHQGKTDEAQELYRAALDDALRIGDLRSVLGNRIKLALIELDTGQVDRAEKMLIECHSDAQQLRDRRRQGEIERYLARIHIARGDFPAARDALMSAIELFERFGMQPELDEAQEVLAQMAK